MLTESTKTVIMFSGSEEVITMKSKQKGFTLVELIVVIAIIGVLAAILIPSLMGYIRNAKLKTANLHAKNTFTAISAALGELYDGNVSNIARHSPVAVEDLDDSIVLEHAVKEFLGNNGINSGYVCWDINSAKKITCAQWCETNANNSIVGQYPNPAEGPDEATTTIGTLLNASSWPQNDQPNLS